VIDARLADARAAGCKDLSPPIGSMCMVLWQGCIHVGRFEDDHRLANIDKLTAPINMMEFPAPVAADTASSKTPWSNQENSIHRNDEGIPMR